MEKVKRSPLALGEWVGVWRCGWVGTTPTHMYMHMHTHRHVHTHSHVNHNKHVGGHLQFLYMYILACVHACGAPLIPPDTPANSRESKSVKMPIKLEHIGIIQFCLKIWDLYTFLPSYILGLICMWGYPITNSIFYFGPKKYIFLLLWASSYKFSSFYTGIW